MSDTPRIDDLGEHTAEADSGSGPCLGPDGDGDGIPDALERDFDFDRDGQPNAEDLDSDDDGIPDSVEAYLPGESCPTLASCDDDGSFNYIDPDSDNDGVLDGDEVVGGTDTCASDSDGDGCPDLAEIAFASACDDLVIVLLGDIP